MVQAGDLQQHACLSSFFLQGWHRTSPRIRGSVEGDVVDTTGAAIAGATVRAANQPVESIEWIEAADYYSILHVKGHTYMLRESITELSRRLDPGSFIRVHRSIIVNLSYVREIYRDGRDEGTVVLMDGQRLKMSKAGRQQFLQHAAGTKAARS